MKHLISTAAALLVSAGIAAAQDKIVFNDGQEPRECIVLSVTYKEVRYRLPQAGDVTQDVKAKSVREIEFGMDSTTPDWTSGRNAWQAGSYTEAAEKFQRVLKDTRASEPLKDFARKHIIEAYLAGRNYPLAIQAAESLRKDRPESFFLKDSFLLQYEAAKLTGDTGAQRDVMAKFKDAGNKLGMSEWGKEVDILNADAFEAAKDFAGALALYDKYRNDPDREVKQRAILGGLRCKPADLAARAQSIIDDQQGKRDGSAKLLMSAYTAKADALLAENKTIAAFTDYMYCVDVLSKRLGEYCREHETAMAKAAIAAAKYAKENKEARPRFLERAEELLGELDGSYKGSPWRKAVLEALAEAKKG